LWLHSLKVAQLLRSAACLHTNQSRSYLNHLVFDCSGVWFTQVYFLKLAVLPRFEINISFPANMITFVQAM